MDINRAGRILLVKRASLATTGYDRGKGCRREGSCIALSMWPKVSFGHVAYANKSNANGVYYLLRHGTIFTETFVKDSSSQIVKKSEKSNKITDFLNYCSGRKRKWRRDPALGDYGTLAEFLSDEAAKGRRLYDSISLQNAVG
jgi:hypothetical protein